MKARVKATGDIVNASYWNTSANGIKYYDIDNSGYTMTEDELDFDFSYTPDYWEKLKHQYAGMAMQGMMAHTNIDYDDIVDLCVEFSHALVEKLKEKEERK